MANDTKDLPETQRMRFEHLDDVVEDPNDKQPAAQQPQKSQKKQTDGQPS